MKSERKSTIILCIYIIIMLVVCALAVQTLKSTTPPQDVTEDETTDTISPVTQIVYIPVISETDSDTTYETEFKTEKESETEETKYTVRSHEGKIGIFTGNDTLVHVIDVYIKTLPKADRNLLEKGFSIIGEDELRSIIEDYTG